MIRLRKILGRQVPWEDVFLSAALNVGSKKNKFPHLLAYYPPAKVNPFQDALYSCASNFSYSTVPLIKLEDLLQVDWPFGLTLHIHWLGGILKQAESEEHAHELLTDFISTIKILKKKNIRIIWTLHNVLPHQTRFEQVEICLRKEMSILTDGIHVLTKDTPSIVSSIYKLDEKKVFYTAHPSYYSYYMPVAKQAVARTELSWAKNSFYFLFFGGIERYKGIKNLLHNFRLLENKYTSLDLRLVIVGPPSNEAYTREIFDFIGPSDSKILFLPRSVPDSDVHLYFSASNVVVMPYESALNSGVSLLAANFERPVVAPNEGAITEIWGKENTLLYEKGMENSFFYAMENSLSQKFSKSFFDRIKKTYSSEKISMDFFSHLNSITIDNEI